MVAANASGRPRANTGDHERDVGQMRAAAVRVVQDVDVALAHASRAGTRRACGRCTGIRVARWIGIAQACASVSPLQREQARGSVEPLLHDRREGALEQRQLHLVGDAVELVADHLERDRDRAPGLRRDAGEAGLVTCGTCQLLFCSSTRLPPASTGPPARLDQGGRVGLLDDRRAAEGVARRQRGAVVDRGLDGLAGAGAAGYGAERP